MPRQFLTYTTRRGTQFGPKAQQRSVMYDIAAECAAEGIAAFKEGVPIEACPYPSGSVNYRAWCEGWEGIKEKVERIGPMVI